MKVLFLALMITMAVPQAWATEVPEEQNQCIQCHGGLTDKYYSTPVSHWGESIHRQNKVACNDCHGGDALATTKEEGHSGTYIGRPRSVDIPFVCGKCHLQNERFFLSGIHGAKRLFSCINCHSNHKVVKAVPEVIKNQNCDSCHEGKNFQQHWVDLVTGKEKKIQDAFDAVETLPGKAHHDPLFGPKLEALSQSHRKLRASYHSLIEASVQEAALPVEEQAKAITSSAKAIKEKEEHSQDRNTLGIAALVLCVLAGGLLWIVEKT